MDDLTTTGSGFNWKKKATFPQNQCGISGCKAKPDGYMPSTRKGQLWYGPICEKCSVKACGHKPTLFSDLLLQRKGDEDLAKLLDIDMKVLEEVKATHVDVVETPAEDMPSVLSIQVAAVPAEEIKKWTEQADAVLKTLESFHISDQMGIDLASELLRDVKTLWQVIETKRKVAGKPFRDQIKKIQAKYKAPQDKLLQAEEILKKKISESVERFQKAQMEAFYAAQAAFRAGDIQSTAMATEHAAANTVQLPDGLSQRTQLRWELVDLREVPPQFLVMQVNAEAVEQALAAGVTQIPGLRIFEVPVLAQRTK